jgi:hypothetical protein
MWILKTAAGILAARQAASTCVQLQQLDYYCSYFVNLAVEAALHA